MQSPNSTSNTAASSGICFSRQDKAVAWLGPAAYGKYVRSPRRDTNAVWPPENKFRSGYWADVVSTTEYYPFGMGMVERGDDGSYRYGFNGKEKDGEGMGGGGSTYDYGFRIYNPGLGKFLSVDPLAPDYPYFTPYQFSGNKAIAFLDLDGLEDLHWKLKYYNEQEGCAVIQLWVSGEQKHKNEITIMQIGRDGSVKREDKRFPFVLLNSDKIEADLDQTFQVERDGPNPLFIQNSGRNGIAGSSGDEGYYAIPINDKMFGDQDRINALNTPNTVRIKASGEQVVTFKTGPFCVKPVTPKGGGANMNFNLGATGPAVINTFTNLLLPDANNDLQKWNQSLQDATSATIQIDEGILNSAFGGALGQLQGLLKSQFPNVSDNNFSIKVNPNSSQSNNASI